MLISSSTSLCIRTPCPPHPQHTPHTLRREEKGQRFPQDGPKLWACLSSPTSTGTTTVTTFIGSILWQGRGKLSGRLRAGRKRGACRGRGSLRRVPASPAGHLWRASRRRPGARPPPATPAGARGMSVLRPRPRLLPGPAPSPLPPCPSGHAPCPSPSPGSSPVPKGIFPRAPPPTAPGPDPSPGAPAFLPPPPRTFKRSMFTSSFSCSTVLRASAILAMLLDMAEDGQDFKSQEGVGD